MAKKNSLILITLNASSQVLVRQNLSHAITLSNIIMEEYSYNNEEVSTHHYY